MASPHASAGTEVYHVVGRLYGLGVVLDHDNGVAAIAKLTEGVEKHSVVAGMQTDGGLVEHIADPLQVAAELGSKTYSLRFSAGKGRSGPVEPEIAKSDTPQKSQACGKLGNNVPCDRRFPRLELHAGDPVIQPVHRQACEAVNRHITEEH